MTIPFWQTRGAQILFLLCLLLSATHGAADEFSTVFAQVNRAQETGNLAAVRKFCAQAESLAGTNAPDWCAVSRGYSEAMSLTEASAEKADLLDHATACAVHAVALAPQDGAAHTTLAVCYAKRCTLAGVKEQVAFSRRFKAEAEKAIALDPRQDVAYYLLGRWNYEVANVGLIARAYVKVVYGGLPKASDDAAIANFQKAIALAPDCILYHAGLASVYQAEGKRTDAIAEWKKCRALKPADGEDRIAQRDAEKRLAALGK